MKVKIDIIVYPKIIVNKIILYFSQYKLPLAISKAKHNLGKKKNTQQISLKNAQSL